MALSILLIGTLVAILFIWLFIEVKRARHKIFAVTMIFLILFFYFSFTIVFKDKTVDYKSIKGVSDATHTYLLWLGSFYGNLKTITVNTIHMDWAGSNINNSSLKTTSIK